MPRILSFAFALALLLLAAAGAGAQESTPAVGSPTAATSMLAGLGFPDLTLTTDGTDFQMPMEVEAGRYRFVVENSNDQLSADVSIAMVPGGLDPADIIAEFQASDESESEEPPASFFALTFVGGAYAFPATTKDAIITLGPGTYIVYEGAYSETDEDAPSADIYKTLTVTGELPTDLTDPPADVTVNMLEMMFEMPDTVPAGPHVWQISDTGSFPHFMVIERAPGPVTEEQVQATLDMFFGTGTPTASPVGTPVEPLDPNSTEFVGQGQILSPTQSNWYEFDFEPGTYIAFCFVTGPGSVPTHASLGMFKIFTVE
jgi:hypothetical protein